MCRVVTADGGRDIQHVYRSEVGLVYLPRQYEAYDEEK